MEILAVHVHDVHRQHAAGGYVRDEIQSLARLRECRRSSARCGSLAFLRKRSERSSQSDVLESLISLFGNRQDLGRKELVPTDHHAASENQQCGRYPKSVKSNAIRHVFH